MNDVFPFGFPIPTAFYLTLYILTFVLHQIFVHYVLAGSLYVAWVTIWPGRGPVPRVEQPLAAMLRDWMPFLLSAAITAGVAPLLFIQIVYQRHFYTANLLLWWRWMVVVPVLILAFYLLYLIKSSRLWRWSFPVRVAVSLGTSMSFVFVGFCWTVNHLLANSEADWPTIYATGRLPFTAVAIGLRMLIWIGGSFATMSVLVSWQLFYRQKLNAEQSKGNGERVDNGLHSVRILAGLTGGGLGVALLAGLGYIIQCDVPTRNMIFGRLILPYLLITLAGVVAQGVGVWFQCRAVKFSVFGLTSTTLAMAITLLGVSIIREGIRVRSVDLTSLAQRHADAAAVGGFGVFLVSAIFVCLLILWCVRIVQKGIMT